MHPFKLTETKARQVGECVRCGAGQRGHVTVYSLMLGNFRAVLCLNCLKELRLTIEEQLMTYPTDEELLRDAPLNECARCNRALPPYGNLDKLYGIQDVKLCLLCLHAYAECAMINGLRPGPAHYPQKEA
jgi:hypothetical protein